MQCQRISSRNATTPTSCNDSQDESLQEELLQLFGDLLTEEEGAALLGLAEGNAGDEDRMGVDQGEGAGGAGRWWISGDWTKLREMEI